MQNLLFLQFFSFFFFHSFSYCIGALQIYSIDLHLQRAFYFVNSVSLAKRKNDAVFAILLLLAIQN